MAGVLQSLNTAFHIKTTALVSISANVNRQAVTFAILLGDTDKGSIEHLILTMIMRTIVSEIIIDGESSDFIHTFLDIVKVHCQEMLDGGRLVQTHEDDLDLTDETCVTLRPDPEPDVNSQDMTLDEDDMTEDGF